MRRRLVSVLAPLALAATGCATAKSIECGAPGPFGGTRMGCEVFFGPVDGKGSLGHGFLILLFWPAWLADKPLSLAADVVTLPYVLVNNPARGVAGRPVEEARRLAADRGYVLAVRHESESVDTLWGRPYGYRRIEVEAEDGVVTRARVVGGLAVPPH